MYEDGTVDVAYSGGMSKQIYPEDFWMLQCDDNMKRKLEARSRADGGEVAPAVPRLNAQSAAARKGSDKRVRAPIGARPKS